MTSAYFTYDKRKVIQALRYHFISRKEIKLMMILINIYAILSAALFFFKVILPLAFLLSSALWFMLMLLFWFVLPNIIYRKVPLFKDRLRANLSRTYFEIENSKGSREWEWKEFSSWMESPHFFICILPAALFSSFQKMPLREMMCMKQGKYLRGVLGVGSRGEV